MQKHCLNVCAPACRSSHWMCNNCCCSTPMLPRNCASCIWPRSCNNNKRRDEWLWHSRCLTDHYMKRSKEQFDTPLWRRAKHQRSNAISMLNLRNTMSTLPPPPQKKRGRRRRRRSIERAAEIIIDKPFACRGGYLRGLANMPSCRCERMGHLLLQPKFFNKCKCEPYEWMPDVPLTYYPKFPCLDPFGNACDDEFAAYLLKYLNGVGSYEARVKKLVNKRFLESLNKLYANVGGGRNGFVGANSYNYDSVEREYEFEGFFGTFNQSKESVKRKTASAAFSPRRNSSFISSFEEDEEKNYSKRYHYPTSVPLEKQPYFRTSPSQILKYLADIYYKNSGAYKVATLPKNVCSGSSFRLAFAMWHHSSTYIF
ncbi:uncharacterized protein LOC105664978 isoform X2 [Ceratitis capitata]|uniref:uncharacterized protein LOC105664978 isoform X2 n=1 Tax=Ceratitis capitata TaxID=7213 RepID=UPI00061883D8|nr:uncharacterized protein LOC105664978 isoform X2 [Ceratitis capitata]